MRISSKCNTRLAHTLLLQYDKDGSLETDKDDEIRHIGYLKDVGYIEAEFELNDKKKPVKAWITRMTNAGEVRIEDFSGKKTTEGGAEASDDGYSEEQRKDIIDNCEEVRKHSAKTYDVLVRSISGGGITLAASVTPYFMSGMKLHKGIWLYTALFCGAVSVVLWSTNLVYSLCLEWDGQKDASERKKKAEEHKLDLAEEDKRILDVRKKNKRNGFFAVIGILLFAIYAGIIAFLKF